MAESAGQPNSTALPWWVRACRVGWKGVRYFWATFLLTLVLPKAVEMLFSDKSLRALPNLWPILEAILDHPLWTLLTFLGLLLLTGLFWLGSRGRSPTPQRALSEHDRVYMLKRLRFQYEQMLAQSLQGMVQIELGLASRSAAVQNVASLSLRLPDQPEQLLPPHTSIVQAYALAQQELLILGEPGAGKSTQLLELAHHLVEQAEHDAAQPLPVVLPLSSWATTHPPLHDWLVEQVALLYHVPKGLSLQWLQGEQLLPLLDGLDEMETSQRAACITAINTYHHEHLQSLVVCSRTNEYETAATQERLALHSAVVVQPLSAEQIDTYLEHLGQPLVALRTTMHKNPVLQELATTPLMVQVLVLTYHGVSIQALFQKEAQLRERIWTDYVGRMVNHKGNVKRYPLKQTRAWLSFLARQMRGHNQTIFFLERLQPDWLPKKPRTAYRWSTGLLVGLPDGLLYELFFGLHSEIKPVEALIWSRDGLRNGLLVGLVVGLFAGLGGGLRDGLVVGLLVGLFVGLLTGLSRHQLTEYLMHSPNEGIRRSITNGLFVGLLDGLLDGLLGGLLGGLTWGLVGGLLVGLLIGLGAAVQHYILRFWLARTHTFPWKAVPFLEDATARILLRRVGGGYSFTHRLLLDYFADLNAQGSPTSTAMPPPPSPAP